MRQKGLPTYDFDTNYGNFDQIKDADDEKKPDDLDEKDSNIPATDDPSTKPAMTQFQMLSSEFMKDVGKLKTDLEAVNQKEGVVFDIKGQTYLQNNPYRKLGLYGTMPQEYYNIGPNSKLNSKLRFYGIIHNPNYCEQVDLYNLAHQETVFQGFNFISDYAGEGNLSLSIPLQYHTIEFLIRTRVLPKLGNDVLPKLTALMPTKNFGKVSNKFRQNKLFI